MSVKITWAPSLESDIASYELQRADDLSGSAWSIVASIAHDLGGVNYENGKFFYNDLTGDESKFYRLVAIDQSDNRSAPSTPFQAASEEAPVENGVKVDHNYGSSGALRYTDINGTPIEGAVVRIWTKIDFDTGNTAAPLAITLTNERGEWQNPVFLATGRTYTIQFHKEGSYGPDSIEVIV